MGKTKAIETLEEQQEVLLTIFQRGWDYAVENLDFSEEAIRGFLESEGLSAQQIDLLSESNTFRDGLFNGDVAALPPELQQVITNIQDIGREVFDTVTDFTRPLLERGGQTDLTSQAGDRMLEIAQGRLPGQVSREEVGLEIMGQRGQTEGTRTVRDRAIDILNTRGFGGMPDLERTVRTAADIVATGGETDKTNQIFQFGADLLRERGFTDETRQVFDFALQSLNNPQSIPGLADAIDRTKAVLDSEGSQGAGILPIEQFLGFARADAANTSMQIARAGQEEAARMGLIPGAVSAGGPASDRAGELMLQNESETTFRAVQENQRLRAGATSDAFRNLTALLSLRRDDPFIGAYTDLLGQTIQASVGNMRTGADLALGAGNLENQRLAIGMEGVMTGSGIAAQRESSARAGILGAEQLELARMGFGADLLAQNVQERIQGIGGLMDINAQEMQTFFNSINSIIGAGQFGANSNIAAGNLALQNQGQRFNTWLSSLGISSDIAQQGQANQLAGIQAMQNQSIPFLNFANNAMNNWTQSGLNMAQIQAQPGFLSRLLQQGLGTAIQAGVGWASGELLGGPERFNFPGNAINLPTPTAVPQLPGAPNVGTPVYQPINFEALDPVQRRMLLG